MSRSSDARLRLMSLLERSALDGERMARKRGRFATIANRHENGTAPVAVSADNLFTTPAPLALRLVDAAGILPAHRVLEPSAGTGRILDALAGRCAEVVAVELCPQLQAILYARYPGVCLKAGDFLGKSASDLGTFDRVVMNPPFRRGLDVRHVLHAITLLRPGGVLVSLVYNGVVQHRHLRPIASTWEVLPDGSFTSEGTSAGVVLMTYTAPLE